MPESILTDLDGRLVGDAAVIEGLPDRLVGVVEVHVLAHDADPSDGLGLLEFADHFLPGPKVRVAALDAHLLEEEGIEALIVEEQGDLVDGRLDVVGADDALELRCW